MKTTQEQNLNDSETWNTVLKLVKTIPKSLRTQSENSKHYLSRVQNLLRTLLISEWSHLAEVMQIDPVIELDCFI